MNVYDLEGRVAVVTGAGAGIGAAIRARLAASGAVALNWDLAGGDDVVDVTDYAAIERARDAALARHGRLDILIANAGISGPTVPTESYPLADWRRVMAVNLDGVFNVCRAIAPVMRGAGYGRIVTIASLAGKEGTPNAPAYSASKAGVMALTKSLGKELAGTGVLVNGIAPAAVETALLEQMSEAHVAAMIAKSPLGRLGTVEEVAELVAWLASAGCSFSTGAIFDLSGGRTTY